MEYQSKILNFRPKISQKAPGNLWDLKTMKFFLDLPGYENFMAEIKEFLSNSLDLESYLPKKIS